MHWYMPHKISGPVEQVIEDLGEMGVKFDVHGGSVWYEVRHDGGRDLLMKHVGWIVVPDEGALSCYFRPGCNARDIRVLLGSTELAMVEAPTKSQGWKRSRTGGRPRWIAQVMVRIQDDDHDGFASRILADADRRWERPLPITETAVPPKIDVVQA